MQHNLPSDTVIHNANLGKYRLVSKIEFSYNQQRHIKVTILNSFFSINLHWKKRKRNPMTMGLGSHIIKLWQHQTSLTNFSSKEQNQMKKVTVFWGFFFFCSQYKQNITSLSLCYFHWKCFDELHSLVLPAITNHSRYTRTESTSSASYYISKEEALLWQLLPKNWLLAGCFPWSLQFWPLQFYCYLSYISSQTALLVFSYTHTAHTQ